MKNALLLFMISSYAVPVVIVSEAHTNHTSVSSIITSPEHRIMIFVCMTLMGLFTLFYEYLRRDSMSFFIICNLLLAIFFVIAFDEDTLIHNGFAIHALLSILSFMLYFFLKMNHTAFAASLFLQIVFADLILDALHTKRAIYTEEALFIANFAVFYLFLHFIASSSTDGCSERVEILDEDDASFQRRG